MIPLAAGATETEVVAAGGDAGPMVEGPFAYDRLGQHYSITRRADPFIASRIRAALGDAASVLNVGAGAGSYEPTDRRAVAVEPSLVMLRQRPDDAAPAICAVAESLPFGANTFDSAMAVLTIHHWTDARKGLAEMQRVAKRRVVVLTWDQAVNDQWWLPSAYFPGIRELDRLRAVPIGIIAEVLGHFSIESVPIPHDCADGFDIAFWRRPHAYLNPEVLASMSNFAVLDPAERAAGAQKLADDLADGTWAARFGHLLQLNELDLGLRLLIHEITLSEAGPGRG
jgi:SAM-dependent methyltransferase